MNKERLMQFLSDAIDSGMKIEIVYQELYAEKSKAKESAERLAGILNGESKEIKIDGSAWYQVDSGQVSGSFFKPSFETVEGKVIAIRNR